MALLEICVDSINKALIAQQAGAHRVELCNNLEVGGITPLYQDIIAAKQKLTIPFFPIIRPRGGNFVYSKSELNTMLNDIAFCKEQGCKGVVLGVLKDDNTIDVATTNVLVKAAGAMQVTFHKAFDDTKNALQSLQQVIDTGCSCILTSGLQSTALQGLDTLQQLISNANGDIIIMPGGNIRSNNISDFITIGATQLHSKVYNSNEVFNEKKYINEIVAMKRLIL